MTWLAIAVALGFLTLVTALRAAWLWWRASRGMPLAARHTDGSEDHVVQMEAELAQAALLNAEAAVWSGATAILSALTAIWSNFGYLVSPH